MTEETEQRNENVLLDAYHNSRILENLNKPNTQFIQNAAQLNKQAKVLLEFFHKFQENLKLNKISSASLRTGSGFLINSENISSGENELDNIVEVIDFDPVRNNMMVIGNKPAANGTVLHWFIYRGLPEINAIIILEDQEILERFNTGAFSKLVYKDGIMNVDLAIKVLKFVKESNITLLFGSIINGIILVGKTMNDTYDLLKINIQKFSKP